MPSDDTFAQISEITARLRHVREDLAHVQAQLLNLSNAGYTLQRTSPPNPKAICQCPECTCTTQTETELEEHVIANHPD